jgi:hypothetical protein
MGRLEELPTDPLLLVAHYEPGDKHREHPVVKHLEFICPGTLEVRLEYYEDADPRKEKRGK